MKIILEIPDDTVEINSLIVLKGNEYYEDKEIILYENDIKELILPEPRLTESYFLSARTEETYNSQHCTFDE